MANRKLYKIGLTGGMGSGKSSILRYIKDQFGDHVNTLDLDTFAHKIYAMDSWTIRNLKHCFGRGVTFQNPENDGQDVINRKYLARTAFRNEYGTTCFRNIVSPGIRELIFNYFEQYQRDLDSGRSSKQLVVAEGATLVESGTFKFFDELWVVTLDKSSAFMRVKMRNPELTDSEIQRRLELQISDQ